MLRLLPRLRDDRLAPVRALPAGNAGTTAALAATLLLGVARSAAALGALAAAGIGHLEAPRLADLVARARGAAMGQYAPGLALWGLVDLLSARLQALASAALIAAYFQWWVAIGLLALLQLARWRTRRL